MCVGVGWARVSMKVSVLYVSSEVLHHSLPHSFETGCLAEPEARLAL